MRRMKCPTCNEEMIELLDAEISRCEASKFIRRCPACLLSWQRLDVASIIEAASSSGYNRTCKLLILDLVNSLPLYELFEFYLISKYPLTVEQFKNLSEKYDNKRHNEQIKKEKDHQRFIINTFRNQS